MDPYEADADGDGVLVCQDDCDDTQASVYPRAPQICDGLNDDCDDPGWPSLAGTNEADDDGDTLSECAGDCDDTHATVYPGATQLCGDGLNNNCAAAGWPSLAGTNEFDDDGDTLSECAGDCDDTHATVYPGAHEICDGLNNDCSSPSWPLLPPGEGDTDMDGSSDCADCDDADATVYPGAPQICGDGRNNDCKAPGWPSLAGTNEADDDGDSLSECDGDCDDTHATVYPGAAQLCDGFNNDCNAPGWPSLAGTNEGDGDSDLITPCGGDCDDTRASVYPGAPQICDRLNNDCNDPGWPTPPPSDTDGDQDLFAACQGDCDDTHASVYPGAPQICGDGLNNDCTSQGWPSLFYTNEGDRDGDTFTQCTGDCSETYATVYPGAPQICDGLNNDCNDPLWPAPLTADRDVDGDGRFTCTGAQPADCNDGNPTVWATPSETTNLRVNYLSIGWQFPADYGATSIRFDVLRTDETADFAGAGVCVLTDVFTLETDDLAAPAPGHAFLYVARARNECPLPLNLGTIGSASDGTPRPALICQ